MIFYSNNKIKKFLNNITEINNKNYLNICCINIYFKRKKKNVYIVYIEIINSFI